MQVNNTINTLYIISFMFNRQKEARTVFEIHEGEYMMIELLVNFSFQALITSRCKKQVETDYTSLQSHL